MPPSSGEVQRRDGDDIGLVGLACARSCLLAVFLDFGACVVKNTARTTSEAFTSEICKNIPDTNQAKDVSNDARLKGKKRRRSSKPEGTEEISPVTKKAKKLSITPKGQRTIAHFFSPTAK